MLKRIASVILCISICLSIFPVGARADIQETADSFAGELEDQGILEDAAADAAANVRTVEDVIAQYKFSWPQGHGFAAEQGNNQIDRIKGTNAVVVGNNNVKNGADRVILKRNGKTILIQDKYYRTASETIGACFDDTGTFKYLDASGSPMQIEVPKDQYDAAVLAMEERISQGNVPGVTNPKEAKSIVRKGSLTYEQAKNLARAGTVESLKYDASNGVISAGCAFGISTLLNYAVCRLNGDDRDTAIRTAAIEGVKCGAGAFCTAVIAGQLAKTGIVNVFKPSTEALTKSLGTDFSEKLLEAYGQKIVTTEGESAAESATKQAARLLRSEVLVAAVTTIVFSVPDAVDLVQGRISRKQFIKNFAVTAVTVVAGTVGYGVGGALANLVVPGVGTIPGGIVGSIIFGTGGGLLADAISDYITSDDADEMYEIVQSQFAQYCENYMVNDEEAQHIIDQFSDMLTDDMFKDMYQSDNREAFIAAEMEPLFEAEVSERETITAPTETEMRESLKEELTGVVYVH